MAVGIIGKKIGMSRVYNEDGALIPVTVIEASDCKIAQIKKTEKDGYSALQLAYGAKKPQNVTKAQAGHYKKAGFAAKAKLRELRMESDKAIENLEPGQTLSVSMFEKGDQVDVAGLTKGRGFTGVMKRHGFPGTKATHGVHEYFRHGGSIGSTTFPGRVLKNLKMPGQHGNQRRTIQNLEIIDVDKKGNILLVKGAVPGARNGLVYITSAKKKAAPAGRSLV